MVPEAATAVRDGAKVAVKPAVLNTLDDHTTSINSNTSALVPATLLNTIKTISGLQSGLMEDPLATLLSTYNSVADSNGIYTVRDYKRLDGTLYMKSTLSGGTSPNYTTDVWKFYAADGTTLKATVTWAIAYDGNGKVQNQVVSSVV
jgi:hypothetical protein